MRSSLSRPQIVVWDNEAEKPNGDPETRYFAEDPWSTNMVPAATDDVRILTHRGADPAILSSTSATATIAFARLRVSLP